MTESRPVDRLVHAALEPGGDPPSETRLTDRAKLGVVLQAAGLLDLAASCGWRMRGRPAQGRVDAAGLLRGLAVEPGQGDALVQVALRELLLRLFGDDSTVAGRGQARRAARILLQSWAQEVEPLSPAEALGEVFRAAPFLWSRPFARQRVAALVGARVYGRWKVPRIAGSAGFRERVMARGEAREAMEGWVGGSQARVLWSPEEARRHPLELAAAGRWPAALRAWERCPPASAEEEVTRAEALFGVGRFEDALTAVTRRRSVRARVLRIWILALLGRPGAARRALKRLEDSRLPDDLAAEAAEAAVRVLGNVRDLAGAKRWVERAERSARSDEARTRAALVGAAAGWDRGDLEAMDAWLARAGDRPANERTAWRWHHVRGLRQHLAGDGEAMVEELTRALRGRRWMRRFEAAGVWNDLGLGRARAGDLAGAERAFLHALRLQEGTQGPRRTTLALCNLAEIRLRRGRLRGVEAAIERSARENAVAGNRRGAVQDLGLQARYELVTGRPEAALARLRTVAAESGAWHGAEIGALAARALGWLGRPDEALEALEAGGALGLGELEAEERPAVWALAGDRGRALAASEGVAAPFWRAFLTGDPVAEGLRAAGSLEPFRRARLVYDAERLEAGVVGPEALRTAAVALRRVGASRFAEELEARDHGPWKAVERYLGLADPRPGDRTKLFLALAPDARLVRRTELGEEVLVEGPGGEGRVVQALRSGRLELSTGSPESPFWRAALALVAREPAIDKPRAGGESDVVRESEAFRRRRIIGRSPVLEAALVRLEKLAASPVPILVHGETGTGKELAARHAHEESPRSAGPFVTLNCAALSESLLLSELFGHVRGAFTGADRDRAGIFEAARGGTVFLDEIGDLPEAAQGKLLRVLQEGEVRRLGESLPRPVDVRVVAATHRDLEAMVRDGGFREDLFYRLRVANVDLPPLRERRDDIPLLVDHFLRRLAPQRRLELTPEAIAKLRAHEWPGNVRELRNVLAVAAALTEGEILEATEIELVEPLRAAPVGNYHRQIEDLRRKLVRDALEVTGGRQAEAARRLGLSRQALSYLVRELGLKIE